MFLISLICLFQLLLIDKIQSKIFNANWTNERIKLKTMQSGDNSKMLILPQPFDYFNNRSFAVSL